MESSIRFFSFFTILTNIMVAIYFSIVVIGQSSSLFRWLEKKYALTPIAVFIFIVCLVYQLVLRSTWSPEGAQKIVDELLHTINPFFFVYYWWRYEKYPTLNLRQFLPWLIYPLTYLAYVLIRGNFSNFYPYPFVNVSEIGMNPVLLNSLVLFGVFVFAAGVFILVDRKWRRSKLNR